MFELCCWTRSRWTARVTDFTTDTTQGADLVAISVSSFAWILRRVLFSIRHLHFVITTFPTGTMSDNENRRPESEPRPILNIPAGNSPITPDANPVFPPDEKRTGNLLQDSWTAIKVR